MDSSDKNSKKYNHEDIYRCFEYNIDTCSRTIYIYSDISYPEESGVDASLAMNVIKGLNILDNYDEKSQKGESQINIILNTDGGAVSHGMAIYDSIKQCKNRVEIKVLGSAMSMGSIILQAGDERLMSENARFMMHYGSFYFSGHSIAANSWAEENKKYNDWMENLFLNIIREKNKNFSKKQLQKLLNEDAVLDAKEALKLNLIDKIF